MYRSLMAMCSSKVNGENWASVVRGKNILEIFNIISSSYVQDRTKLLRSVNFADCNRRTTVVDKVVSKATGKVYARKRINRKLMFGFDKNAQKVYENELETLKKVADHEHLIKVRATYTDKKHLVMLLQPVADENLKEYMTRKPLNESDSSVGERARLRTYFGCLAHTIQILHHSEILHKDLKPENILLKSGHLILTDFGTAFDWSKTGQSMTRSNANDLRTPRYQSPEAALGMFHRSSDIWSLGVVFLEMVTFLQGRTLADMDTFLSSHGQCVTSIHNNIEGAMNWFEELHVSNTGSVIDNEPLTWIKGMLNRVQSNRPTAGDLFEGIVAFQDGMFCGHCCLDTESSSDEGYESDRDVLSDIEETKEPEISVSGDHQRPVDTALKDGKQEQSMSRITSTGKVAYSGVAAAVTPLVNMPIEYQTSGQSIADDAVSTAGTYLGMPSGDYLPDHTLISSISPLPAIPQTRSKVEKIAKDGSALNHQKTLVKPKTKTLIRERDKFVQWLASVTEKFALLQSQHRSKKPLVNPGRHTPSVETQRIKNFLSSLPEEVTEFDDALESFDDFRCGTMPFKSFNRSRTIPIVAEDVGRSKSQEDLQSSPHILQEKNDEHQFAEVENSRLVHYASDGDLNKTLAISKEILDITKKEFKEFSNRCRLPDLRQAVERELTDNLERQRSDHKIDCEISHIAVTHPKEPLTLPAPYEHESSAAAKIIEIESPNSKTSTLDGIHARTDDTAGDVLLALQQQKKQANQKPSMGGDLTKGEISSEVSTDSGPPQLSASAQNDISSKALAAMKPPPRLRAFVRKGTARRRSKSESATDLMERIRDDKSSEAPTSVMSAGTRATVFGGLIGLRWNDKFYGYLPHFVANGRVGAVRECLKAGCNPGREEKPRWAPVYNAVRGCSKEHLKCLRELVFYGADVNARRSTNGRTPLHYAVESKPWSGYFSVICTLLVAGADPNIRDGANDLPILMLLDGKGPLPKEKRDALDLLLLPNFNTDLKVKSATGDNLLHLAIRRKDAYTVDALLEKMYQIGDSASYLMHEHNGSGFTPILLALTIFQLGEESDEELEIIEYLLTDGANTDDRDLTQGKTPLHLIIEGSKNSIALELFCRHSANPQLPDKSGQTAVALVAKLRGSYPQDRWYLFAARRISNRLTTEDYRPPELEAFFAKETENQRAPLSI